MNNDQEKLMKPVPRIPKAEAIAQIIRQISDLKAQLEASKAQLKAAVSPGKYALNFQVNALKKQIHACQLRMERVRKDPKADVIWPDQLSA